MKFVIHIFLIFIFSLINPIDSNAHLLDAVSPPELEPLQNDPWEQTIKAFPLEAIDIKNTSITFQIEISKTGSVQKAQIQSPLQDLQPNTLSLVNVLTQEVKKLRFKPALKKGHPIPVLIKYIVYIKKNTNQVMARHIEESKPSESSKIAYETVIDDQILKDLNRKILLVNEIVSTAGTQGDPMKVIQTFPGIARAPFGTGLLAIRGAAPFESRFFLDDLEIPILFHFGGLRTVFNSSLLSQIDFIPGGFDGRYGDAIGGIVASRIRKPKKDRLHGLLDINTFDSQLLLEGPLGNPSSGTSFFLTARRSYIDLILKSLFKGRDDLSLTVAPRYYDYFAELQQESPGKTLQKIQFYGSDDALAFLLKKPIDSDPSLRGDFRNETSFQKLAFHHQKIFNQLKYQPLFQSRISLGRERIYIDTSNGPLVNIRNNSLSLRQDFVLKWTPDISSTFGIQGDLNEYDVSVRIPSPDNSGGVPTPFSATRMLTTQQKGWEPQGALYQILQWQPSPQTELRPSLRLGSSRWGNPLTIDPRISLRHILTDSWTIKGHAGIYHQSPLPQEAAHQIGQPGLKSRYAFQYGTGAELNTWALETPFTVDTQVYYRDIHRQIVATGDNRNYSNDGRGRSYGTEVYFKYGSITSVNGWISYTLSRSELRDLSGSGYHKVSTDQTHNLTILQNYPLGSSWELGWRFRFTTGSPQTPIEDSVYSGDGDAYIPVRGQLFSRRLAPFHQLDLRGEKRWFFDSWKLTAFLEINNIYNRKNPEATLYSYDFKKRKDITGLPFLPIFGLKGDF